MSTRGYFPWSTFNFRQDRNKHKRRHCIPPSCPKRGANFGLLIPPEVELCPWNKSLSQRKMNCPPWRIFFMVGSGFLPINSRKGLALPSGSTENELELSLLEGLLNTGTCLVFLPKCVYACLGMWRRVSQTWGGTPASLLTRAGTQADPSALLTQFPHL